MKTKNKILALLILLLCCGKMSWAQYEYYGGSGDGHASGAFGSVTCPTPVQNYAYFGGNGDGFSTDSVKYTTCGTANQFYAYYGGNGDGHSSGEDHNVNCPTAFQFYAYFGGNGDGYGNDTSIHCPTVPPVASFTASSTNICVGDTVHFFDTSTQSPVIWAWTFPGGAPDDTTLQNPTVVYSTPGSYLVTFEPQNWIGSDSIGIAGYITVNALPVATASTSPICQASSSSIALTGSTGNIQWQSSTNNISFSNIGGATSAPLNTGALSVTTYFRDSITSGGCAGRKSLSDTVVVHPTSVAGTATASPSPICNGSASTITLTGNTGTIQWQDSPNNSVFTNISSATSSTYNTPALSSTKYYRAVVTSGVCTSANSVSDTVTVHPTSVGGAATTGTSPICQGSTSSITLTGNTGTIQWQDSPNNSVFTNISGATSSTYNTPALSSTKYYRAVVTSGVCSSANSVSDTVVVSPTTVGGTATASPSPICNGNTSTITLTGNTGTIQWQDSSSLATWTNIGGATTSPFTTPALSANRFYRAVVTSGVCPSANSAKDTVVVQPTSAGGTATASPSPICQGSTSTITLTGNTGTIQWQDSSSLATWTNIGGATTSPFTTPALSQTKYYRAVVTSGVCPSANSIKDTVIVNPTSVGGTATASPSPICNGSTSTITLTGNTGTMQWQDSSSLATWTNISGATTSPFTTPALSANRYYRAVVTSGVCPSANSVKDTVVVNPTTVGGTATASPSTICQGSTSAITLTGNTGTIQWQDSSSLATWTNIIGATSSPFTTPALSQTKYYRAVVTSGVCPSANSIKDTVIVNPTSAGGTATAVPSQICQGSTSTITLTGNTGTIQWQDSSSLATWTNISGATSSPFITPALSQSKYYRAVVTSGVCPSSNSVKDTVLVNPTTVGGIATASPSPICEGSTSTITLTGYTGAIQWQDSSTAATWTNIAGAAATPYTTVALSATTYYRAVVTSGVCPSANSLKDVVVVHPATVGGTATASPSPICEGSTSTITLTGNTGTIQWQDSSGAATWTNIGGATTSPFNTPSLTATTFYRAVVISGVCPTANSVIDTVVVNPASVGGTVTASPSPICAGETSTITITGNTGTIQWQDSPDNSAWTNIGGAISSPYTTAALSSTTYYRAVVTSGACPDANSSSDTVFVNPLPVVALTLTPDKICLDDPAYPLTGGTPAGGTYSGTGVTAGNFDASVSGAGTFEIHYIFTDGNNCTSSDSADLVVDPCTVISGAPSVEVTTVYPNPFTSNTTVFISGDISGLTYVVRDITGKEIITGTVTENNLVIHGNELAAGIYYFEMRKNDSGNIVHQIIVKQ